MLNSQSLVDKFCDRAGSTELTKEEIVCHLVTASQEPTAMETDPPNGSAQVCFNGRGVFLSRGCLGIQ